MGTLKHDWLTDHLIDFEYKKYILLDYLQKSKRQFNEMKLFPTLSELIFHYRNLMHYIESKELIDENLPVEMAAMDIKAMKLLYERISQDDELMAVLNEIVAYAMPQLEDAIYEGREIYEIVEDHIRVDTVGIVPLYNKEGYFILSNDEEESAYVYRYDVSAIEKPDESYRTISSEFVRTVVKSKYETVDDVKLALIKENKELPNPALYRFHSTLDVPHDETFLPISKRILLKEILTAA
ncbi:MAG: hypothetical protein HKN45_09575 [Flavobacteriales bacterium]|nr:hypothetical protein [Flavobacteriales bacterium]